MNAYIYLANIVKGIEGLRRPGKEALGHKQPCWLGGSPPRAQGVARITPCVSHGHQVRMSGNEKRVLHRSGKQQEKETCIIHKAFFCHQPELKIHLRTEDFLFLVMDINMYWVVSSFVYVCYSLTFISGSWLVATHCTPQIPAPEVTIAWCSGRPSANHGLVVRGWVDQSPCFLFLRKQFPTFLLLSCCSHCCPLIIDLRWGSSAFGQPESPKWIMRTCANTTLAF